VSNQEVRDALRQELHRLTTEDVTEEELAKFRRRARTSLLYSLKNNMGLAMHLSSSHILFGDWREMFEALERFDQVTAADIRRVAGYTFTEANRVVAQIETVPPPAARPMEHPQR